MEAKFQRFSSDLAHSQALLADSKAGDEGAEDVAAKFDQDFFLPPPLSNKMAVLAAEPYRVDGVELFDEAGCLNTVYHTAPAAVAAAAVAVADKNDDQVKKMQPMEMEDVEDGSGYKPVPSQA
jgi:hypothetical protein